MDVTAPDGRRWTVRRRWAPRLGQERVHQRMWRRTKETMSGIAEWGNVLDPVSELPGIGVAAGIVVGIALLFVVVPLAIAVVDLAILLLLASGGAVIRSLGWHPWTIEAVADDGTREQWRARGWRGSKRQVAAVASALAAGTAPPSA